jgi:hypothetical protein
MLAAFDANGNRTSITYPGGTVALYNYDSLNRVSGVATIDCSGCIDPRPLASFAYEGPDRLSRIARNNGINTRLVWDGQRDVPNAPGDFGWKQVSTINHQRAGGQTVLDRRGFAYDGNQNKTLYAQLLPFVQGQPTGTNVFSYTPLDQLSRAINTKGTGATVRSYHLDGQGNIIDVTNDLTLDLYVRDATLPEPADFQMDRYTLTPFNSQQYDHNGNLILMTPVAPGGVSTHFAYDCADRLVEVSRGDAFEPVASFRYDALGRRITKTVPGAGAPALPVTTYFVYDDGGIIQERDGGSGSLAAETILFGQSGAAKGEPKVICRRDFLGNLLYYTLEDENNVALALTDVNGGVIERYDYDDHGAPTFLTSDGLPLFSNGQPVSQSLVGYPYLFLGMFWDAETGLYLDTRWDNDPYVEDAMRAYDPKAGRYTSRASSQVNCWGENAYTFEGGNPWSRRGRVKENGQWWTARGTSRPLVAKGGSADRWRDNGQWWGGISSSTGASADRAINNGQWWSAGRGISSPPGASTDWECWGIGRGISSPMGGSADRMQTGKVKWFNDSKGFGFRNKDGLTGHVTLIK